MRRQSLFWSIAVFGIVGTVYGAYLLIYHFDHGKGLFIPALLLLIFGSIALVVSMVLSFFTYRAQWKKKQIVVLQEEEDDIEEEKEDEVVEEKPTPEIKHEPEHESTKEEYAPRPERTYESSPSYSASTVYVKQIGYGPLLRIYGGRFLDMRTNTYYRLEDNMVMQDGGGPVFEIRGNQIKDAFGSYLYEVSGNNINKVFGGFYASIDGNYITLYDLSVKYEMSDSLSKRQVLVVAALLFGKY